MTQTIEDLHVYLRTVRQNERTSLSVLAGLVNEGATVLDLGCGSGALGQYLKETKGCISDGLTWSDAEAEHARPHYRHVSVADLETCNLLEIFAGKTYDFIVCADVLEHLRQPERVLEACRSLIKPQGLLLTSVPNAGYAGLVAELLQGDFRYRPEGLLDRTHLRFFTRRSLARFMGENRWTLNSVDTIRRELPESEFSTPFDQLPPAVSRYLLAVQDSLTYQFIGVAQPAAAPVTGEQGGTPDTKPAHALFTAQLYLGHDGEYAEDSKLSEAGVIGRERQTLRFALPSSEHLTHLRFDPADRPGFMHLYSFTLRNAADQVVWTWSAHTESGALLAETPHSQLVWQSPLTAAAPATLLLLTGEDPWLQLPIEAHRIAEVAATGGALEVEIGWPMSADYLALAGCVRPLQSEITTSRARAAAEQERLRNERRAIEAAFERERLEAARRYQETTQAADAERNRLLGEQNALLNIKDGLTRQRSELLRESAEHRRNSERLEDDLGRTQREFAELAQHLRSIESSTVFRATRPLVHTKMRIDRLLGRGPRQSPLSPDETEKKTSSARPLEPTSHPVDVIVPVYRGLADTQLCIDSVLASPVRVPYRLVVINDCSPEPEVTQWLRERASQDSRITLLENPENLGFVGTVNRGMALSESNDVLLLNSDTEVANDWLDRILSAAYSDQRIATVTPFSTNATICSYPQYCKDNALVPGYDTARMDALCARTNPGAMVDVPTGVGFCMYIRRDSLRQVGLFDTENFGKGYGEENDFCQRALQAGWRNVHLMDTFVLHTGGVSFGDSKSPRELAAMETLARLHPRYARDVHAFVQADPARPYRLALDAARIAESGLPVILNVLHDRAGGTLRHVRELAEHLADQAVSLTLSPSPNHSVVLRLSREEEAFELTFQVDTQYEQLLDVLRRLGVGHVHFHHLLGHSQSIRDLPHRLGVAYDFTAHDYYSYCTHISLTGIDNRYAPEPGPGQCACCPPDMEAPAYGTVAQWRGVNARLLVGARHVFAPSHDTARRIRAFVPAV
ncbi:MAG: methyltransferase domain-containing protein, partial [Hyphomicrobiales bacterium]